MNEKFLKAISALSITLLLVLFIVLFFNMPKTLEPDIKAETILNIDDFKLDLKHLNLPKDINVASAKKYESRYYISDAFAKKVYCFDENSNMIWSSSGENKFIIPNQKFPLDISEDGSLWVANTGKKQLELLDIKTGKFIASWKPKELFKGCCNPVEIMVLDNGRFLMMEKGTKLLKLFQPDGSEKVLADLDQDWLKYILFRENQTIKYCDGKLIKNIEIKE